MKGKKGRPTLDDNKINFYREQLYRELSHMFEWEGLPSTVPQDYLERNLIRNGYVLYYEDDNIGQDVLVASPTGFNRHNLPTHAHSVINTTDSTIQHTQVSRNIKRLSDGGNVVEEFNPRTDGVLISNMYRGESMREIVNHYAERLALAQQAFDTNLLWANIPYIFQTDSQDTLLSIQKMFASIFNGEPFIIVDKNLFLDNKDRTGVPTAIPFIGKELMDVQNEIMMKFRQTVGFNTAGVDKAERVNTLEVKSNDQHTKTVVQIMLEQRQIACDNINAFFGQNVSVRLVGAEEQEELYAEGEEGEEIGAGDGGIEELT